MTDFQRGDRVRIEGTVKYVGGTIGVLHPLAEIGGECITYFLPRHLALIDRPAPSPQPEPTGLVERLTAITLGDNAPMEHGSTAPIMRAISDARRAALAVADWLDEDHPGTSTGSWWANLIRREVGESS